MESKRDYPCVLCNKRTKPLERRFLKGPGYKGLRRYLLKFYFIQVTENDVTCNKCRARYYRETQTKVQKIPISPEISLGAEKSPKHISLPIPSVGGSHSTCFVCKRRGPKLLVVPLSARNELFIEGNVLIPAGSRCCPLHISDASFTTDALTSILPREMQTKTAFNRTDIMNLLQILRNDAKTKADKRIDFDGSKMSPGDYKNLLGIDKDQFETLCSYIKSGSIRDTKVRSTKTCIGILLTKLRSGMSNKMLSTVFNRVVGICSHCTTVIWYLGYARHQNKQWQANKNWFDFVQDAASQPYDIDSSDDDELCPDVLQEE